MNPANFDRLAAGYRVLEYLAFGRDLERARFGLLPQLAACRSILVLGEGDGRCLARLVQAAPSARIHCVDASAAMLALARSRLPARDLAARVTMQQADALALPLPAAAFDAVLTLFFLDCFTPGQAAQLIPRIAAALQPAARWLYADFALPASPGPRLRARLWLGLLYGFFRWRTGLAARALPPAESLIGQAGFRAVAVQERQHGLLRTVCFARP